MRNSSSNWLDALTDGRMLRSWLSLVAHFAFGWFYLLVLLMGYMFSILAIPILVGIPMLLMMLSITCNLAVIDRQIFATLLNVDLTHIEAEPFVPGGGLGRRLRAYLTNLTTWRSLVYLGLKLPLGLVSIFLAGLLLIPILFEILVLAPLTIDMHLIGVRLLRWSALAIYKLNVMVLPTRKAKRTLQAEDHIAQRRHNLDYYVGDDGELSTYGSYSTSTSQTAKSSRS